MNAKRPSGRFPDTADGRRRVYEYGPGPNIDPDPMAPFDPAALVGPAVDWGGLRAAAGRRAGDAMGARATCARTWQLICVMGACQAHQKRGPPRPPPAPPTRPAERRSDFQAQAQASWRVRLCVPLPLASVLQDASNTLTRGVSPARLC